MENKLKELVRILNLVLKDSEMNYPILLKFEKENPSTIYSNLNHFPNEKNLLSLITERKNKIQEEDNIRNYIQKISSPQISSREFSTFSSLIKDFFSKNIDNTRLFLIMIDEITKIKPNRQVIEQVLNFTPLVKFDSNILEFYKSTIQYVFLNEGLESTFEILLKILSEEDLENINTVNILYPDFKWILLDSSISAPFLKFFGCVYALIPPYDALKILIKIVNEFKIIEKRSLINEFLLDLFDENFKFLEIYPRY
jgi:hypothetical protein